MALCSGAAPLTRAVRPYESSGNHKKAVKQGFCRSIMIDHGLLTVI
jgi:hypothetical protein